jgi:hypothetical protein
MRPATPALAAVLAATLAVAGTAAAAQETSGYTVIETLIASHNPCAGLRTELAGQTIGLDRFDDVELRAASASLAGDDVGLTLSGRLSCRTSDGSLLAGDASSDIDATAALSLADCDAADVSVALSNFGGSLAAVVEALRPAIELQLAEAARPMLADACRQFRGTPQE